MSTLQILLCPFAMGTVRELRVAALLQGVLVGTANVKEQGAGVATIYQLFVRTEERGKGVGTRIVEEVERELAANAFKVVNALVERDGPMGFWGALGYEVVHCEGGVRVVAHKLGERCTCQSVSNFTRATSDERTAASKEETKLCQ